jgi:DNA modification methylase
MTNAAQYPRNTILFGDCLTILPQLAATSVDFILTDPPYITRYKPRDGRSVPNDDNDAWLKPAFGEMFRVLRRDSFAISFYGWPHADRFLQAYRAAGFRVVGHFVFPKRYTSSEKYLRYQHECAYLLAKGIRKYLRLLSAMSSTGPLAAISSIPRRNPCPCYSH